MLKPILLVCQGCLSGESMVKGAREMAQFKLRIPDELLKELKQVAKENMRSVNAEILLRLVKEDYRKRINDF